MRRSSGVSEAARSIFGEPLQDVADSFALLPVSIAEGHRNFADACQALPPLGAAVVPSVPRVKVLSFACSESPRPSGTWTPPIVEPEEFSLAGWGVSVSR